jgi:hypothetical protein
VICNIYGLLLLAYPVDFRRKFGREMMLMLKSRTHDVLENGTGADLVAFLVHISGDWAITALKENAMTGTLVFRLRWIFALPLAIVAANAVARLSVFFIRDIPQYGTIGSVFAFFTAAVFVTVGVCVVPNRRDAVARIALAVVAVLALILMTMGVWRGVSVQFLGGVCGLLGGGLAYLPWRLHSSKPARA